MHQYYKRTLTALLLWLIMTDDQLRQPALPSVRNEMIVGPKKGKPKGQW